MATVLMTKGSQSILVDSSAVAVHVLAGWVRAPITYADQKITVPSGAEVDFDGGALKIDNIALEASAEEINTLAGAPAPDAGELEIVHPRHYQITPAAVGAAAIHAAIPLTDAAQTITAAITNPDAPRTVTIKGNAAGTPNGAKLLDLYYYLA